MAWKRSLSRCLWIVCAVLVAAGCQEQEPIREYSVPKDPPVRLLAVMVPGDDTTWFFKLMGPAPEVAKHVETFDAFLASVRFGKAGGEPIQWTVPEDWSEEHTDKRFEALVRFSGKGVPLPITISQLGGPQARDVRANLDRWRVKQLGLEEISEGELKKLENNFQVDGRKATRVDFTGPGSSKMGRSFESAVPRRPFTFSKPRDWEEQPADAVAGIRREAVFRIVQGDRTAQTTIVRLADRGGGALPNVNRWRDELGLKPTTEDQLRQDLRSLDSRSGRVNYIELTGRAGNEARSTLGAWLTHGGQTWFITMKGPTDLVRSQKPDFEAFVESFRLDSGAGVAHE